MQVPVPFSFKFAGTDYGSGRNGGVHASNYGLITFGGGTGGLVGSTALAPSPLPACLEVVPKYALHSARQSADAAGTPPALYMSQPTVSNNSPTLKSIHIGSRSTIWWLALLTQQLGSGAEQRLVVRYEGGSNPAQSPVPDIAWEASLWANNSLSICIGGLHALAGGRGALVGVSDGGGRWLAQQELRLNSMYVISNLGGFV
jgi:hypothetical protein